MKLFCGLRYDLNRKKYQGQQKEVFHAGSFVT